VTAFRQRLNYNEKDIVCLYTGRFTASKGPEILSGAIRWLQENGHTQFKGLFVGQGDDLAERSILSTPGCKIHPFVEARELSLFYQAFDVGVWPLQESTSQLDAAACGMPIIINEKVQDTERIKGNGLAYRDRDPVDLARQILNLQSGDQRRQMGIIGSKKVADKFSWRSTALDREIDFNVV
jgi:glycosyltransferase involved in cell wall biosynthesis